MKQAFILRGLPGSGKTHYAQSLADDLVAGDASQYFICSTDDFFVQDGHYQFDKHKLPEYHNLNLARYIKALAEGIPLVIVDNTNIKKWEFIAYIEAAHALGYQVKEVIVGEVKDKAMQHLYAQRNTHKVALRTIAKMAYQFEW
ncbi:MULTISPECIES: ATP-binding protein [Pseudoalteromonas]|uniref:ATP-binding protein n=1 Tax=Pseudoalteromonas ruthenica TaxID=151081 RepID=A0A0F4Q0G6_9GAMM|nr:MULTISPECIES: ATP-binding protein [Pseudoalteromonas]KJY99755.1 ATPase AAA [Pseudoalteromonas ruthenica]KJZ00027.1 ATPase AAA [Pseudoalteromonas ruthenica]MCF2861535.1 ATP-binding protein [Pseudoalteromonas sp. CNAT2-18]MCG7542697.1 ATP-binding protein [Pseudoalteromonas sp. MM17-2]MCG7557427.1 ATP-binding protein [Pseudoalteromonas sp. CNAT2-18.1]|tara:strand:- start:7723 stop:8154 length:432 start_codon:yes stop_codon:yes gene_type:complete